MANQLWRCGATGQRRRGARLSELRCAIDAGVRSDLIAEPLWCCLADDWTCDVRSELKRRYFDAAGVLDHVEGSIIGYVLADELGAGAIKEYVRTINAPEMLAGDATLGVAFQALANRERRFIRSSQCVDKIITRSDLNKPPMRVYLFAAVSLLEQHMSYWIARHYEEPEWLRTIGDKRAEKARETHVERNKDGQEVALFECLQFCDKSTLVQEEPALMETLGLKSKKQAKRVLRRAGKLRDTLAHSQHDISLGLRWDALVELVEWLDAAVTRSDNLIDGSPAE